MVRPRKTRWVNYEPEVTYFKPQAVPLSQIEEIDLTIDELEALRLSNLEKISQLDAALRMNIHQSTFQRTLAKAREKITDALVNGKAIKIHGGEYEMPGGDGTGPAGFGRGMGRGRFVRGRGFGGPDVCRCPSCGKEAAHIRGQPCVKQKCPKCGTMMVRGDL